MISEVAKEGSVIFVEGGSIGGVEIDGLVEEGEWEATGLVGGLVAGLGGLGFAVEVGAGSRMGRSEDGQAAVTVFGGLFTVIVSESLSK